MNYTKLIPAIAAVALMGGVAIHYYDQPKLAHVLVGLDPSPSVERNCTGLKTRAKTFLNGKPGIREGSTLGMLVMGTDAGNQQPSLLFSLPIPIPSDSVYSHDDTKFREAEDQLFSSIEQVCQTAVVGVRSPIYAMVQEGIAHLRSDTLGCSAEGRCYFVVKTDLEEDVHVGLAAAIARTARETNVEVPADLAKSLDNAGIVIQVCGTSEIRPHRERGPVSTSPEARIQVWKQLFTHPELVSFSPYCSQ